MADLTDGMDNERSSIYPVCTADIPLSCVLLAAHPEKMAAPQRLVLPFLINRMALKKSLEFRGGFESFPANNSISSIGSSLRCKLPSDEQ